MSILTRQHFLAVCALLVCQLPLPGQTPLSSANTIGVFRQGTWIVNASGNHSYQGGASDPVFPFGLSGDQPVVGNWSGANPAVLQVGVFRDGYWYLDWNNDQMWDQADEDGGTPAFGGAGDIAVLGDWNHDGHLRIGVVRNVSGTLYWYVQTGCESGAAVCNYDANYTAAFTWGVAGDIPVVGDWDHTGVLRIGVVRSGTWIVNLANCQGDVVDCNGYPGTTQYAYGQPSSFSFWGSGTGTPVVGNWAGGYLSEGTFNQGEWSVVDNNLNPYGYWSYGVSGDIPVTGPWNAGVQFNDLTQSSGYFYVGDNFSVTATGQAYSTVAVSENGGPIVTVGTTNAQGVWTTTGSWALGDVGNYTETWYVAGLQAVPGLAFAVLGPVDPPPAPYSNYLAPAPAPQPAPCNVTGTWTDTSSSPGALTWYLNQPNNAVNGSAVAAFSTGTTTYTISSGSFTAGVATLKAVNPNPAYDDNGIDWATEIDATVVLASCSSGAAGEVYSFPDQVYNFQNYPAHTVNANGTFTLTTPPFTFRVSPAPYLLLSTGDTNVTITTTASNSQFGMSNVAYIVSAPVNPVVMGVSVTNCAAALGIQLGDGTGTASSVVTASPAGCSGIFTAQAAVAGTVTQNLTQIIVPPQILLQVMYGEAHNQAVAYVNDPTQQALGATIRNRFGDSIYFAGSTNYQNTITPTQFFGINTSITTGTTAQGVQSPELINAAAVFAGTTTEYVANAKCFFSPDANGWSSIQAALISGTTVLPSVNFDPKCFSTNRQFVYKSSISPNTNNSGAPAFIFEQSRNLTDPAVIQIQ